MAVNRYTMDDFKRLSKIGEGTYGVVYKAVNKKTGDTVAMKKIRLDDNEDEGIPQTTLREVATLKQLNHPYIVALLDVIMEEARLVLVFEFLSTDLHNYLGALKPDERLEVPLLKSFLYQICHGMCYCHQRAIMHRDLKPQNLLVDAEKNIIKLADFGLARQTGIPLRAYTHEVVTLWYRAPEVLLGAEMYCFGVDIWSIGCIFAEMATLKALFQGDSEISEVMEIFRILGTPTQEEWPEMADLPDMRPDFPQFAGGKLTAKVGKYLEPRGIELLRETLKYNPLDRISAKRMLAHAYFDDLDKSALPAGAYAGGLELTPPARPTHAAAPAAEKRVDTSAFAKRLDFGDSSEDEENTAPREQDTTASNTAAAVADDASK